MATAIRRYTAEQLHGLRESPLVQRPDNLQPIESYLDEGSPQATRKEENVKQRLPKLPAAALASTGQDSSPMGSFSTGRPTLPARSSAMRGTGDDVSLGPPRTMFPSSRNVPKLSDVQGKSSPEDSTPADESESARSRFFSDRQINRRSMNEKDGAENNSGRNWANVRERRGQRDGGSREEKDDGDRRNGYGTRQDPRWGGQRDDKQNGERRGGWREREARRDRDQDRHEKEPEWMDEPVVKQEKELGLGMARTQDEFQKWKESMSKKSKGEPEQEEAPTPAPEPPAPASKPAVAPLKLEGFDSSLFGGWGGGTTSTPQSATTPSAGTGSIKVATVKGGKTSRFASMFKPVEPEPGPLHPPMPVEEPVQQQANGTKKTSAEDHEGFNRVLAMLGSAKISQPPPPAPALPVEQAPASPPPTSKPAGTNGTIKKSRFKDMFSQKSPERLQSPQQGGVQLGDSLFGSDGRPTSEEPRHIFHGAPPQQREQQIPRTQEQAASMSPAPNGIPFNAMREQQPRPSSSRNQKEMFDSPSRGAASPDVNIQNLLAQRQRPPMQSNDSQKLLNLLKKDTGSRPQSQQALPSQGGIDQLQLQQWLATQQPSPMPQEPQAPKPRVPQQPPGHFEEQLMRNYQPEQPQQPMYGMPERRSHQRAPPGFGVHDEHSIFLQQQQQQQLRRQQQYGEHPQPRRASGHPGLPPMQIPPQQQFPPDLHQLSSPGGAPPPGFGPPIPRQVYPQHINHFQGAQQEQRGPPPPPGFASLQSTQGNAPPGFYGGPQGMPPGFQQTQQIRSPIDGMPPMRFNQNGSMGGGRPI